MNITRKQLLYWGTVALIAFFFLEFFWPLMYSHEGTETQQPSVEAPSAFTGRVIVPAKILYFSGDAFVSCNESNADFLGLLRAARGVESVFAVSDSGFVVKVNSSAGENASDAAFAGLAELVDGECGVGSTVLRNAGLEIGEDNLTFSSLESLNDSRVLYRRDVVDAFRAAGGRDVQGFVEAALPVNETVQVAVTVKMLGTQIIDKPQVEQLRFTQPFAQ